MRFLFPVCLAVLLAVIRAGDAPAASDFRTVSSFRILIDGNDMEALYDEMGTEKFRRQMFKLCGMDPEMHSAHFWKILGGRTSFEIDLSAFGDAPGTEALRKDLINYVICRRQGLSRNFILPRLRPVRDSDKISKEMKHVLMWAREILPGIREADLRPVTGKLLSFPRLNSDEIKYVFFQDETVTHLFAVPRENDLKSMPWNIWISSRDVEHQDKAETLAIIRNAERRVFEETKQKPGEREWIGTFWIILSDELIRHGIKGWVSPETLNPFGHFH